ncbi:Sigma-70, region 4 family [Verrucomicrobiia bacterium DG1235]|nr:Sigma-70, region 4 family [Verrucomicrobiae bacterium DG1235]
MQKGGTDLAFCRHHARLPPLLGISEGSVPRSSNPARIELGHDRITRQQLESYLTGKDKDIQLNNTKHLVIWRKMPSQNLPQYPALSKRETEIYELLLAGLTLPEIAADLGISQRTVEKHVENIYKKLEVHSYNELLFSS